MSTLKTVARFITPTFEARRFDTTFFASVSFYSCAIDRSNYDNGDGHHTLLLFYTPPISVLFLPVLPQGVLTDATANYDGVETVSMTWLNPEEVVRCSSLSGLLFFFSSFCVLDEI